jgi:hypothetical protein
MIVPVMIGPSAILVIDHRAILTVHAVNFSLEKTVPDVISVIVRSVTIVTVALAVNSNPVMIVPVMIVSGAILAAVTGVDAMAVHASLDVITAAVTPEVGASRAALTGAIPGRALRTVVVSVHAQKIVAPRIGATRVSAPKAGAAKVIPGSVVSDAARITVLVGCPSPVVAGTKSKRRGIRPQVQRARGVFIMTPLKFF